MNFIKAYHSCFLTDVKIAKDMIIVEDSYKNRYYVETDNAEAVGSFKTWFKQVFMKGIAQTISIFQYEIKPIEEGISGMFIVKFMNLDNTQKEKTV